MCMPPSPHYLSATCIFAPTKKRRAPRRVQGFNHRVFGNADVARGCTSNSFDLERRGLTDTKTATKRQAYPTTQTVLNIIGGIRKLMAAKLDFCTKKNILCVSDGEPNVP